MAKRFIPIASPKQEAVDRQNPQPNEIWHATEFNDIDNLINRRNKTRSFNSVLLFNDHYSNGTYDLSGGDLALTIDNTDASPGFQTFTRLVGDDVHTLTFSGANWFKLFGVTSGDVISGEQLLVVTWTANGAVAEIRSNKDRSQIKDYEWSGTAGQSNFVIPSASSNEIQAVVTLSILPHQA